jgi:hypothetical protein
LLLNFRLIYFSPYLVVLLFLRAGYPQFLLIDEYACINILVSWNAQVVPIVMCGTLAKTRDLCHDIKAWQQKT